MVYSSYNIIEIHCHFTAPLSFYESLSWMIMFAQQLEAAPTNTILVNEDYYTPDDFWLSQF